MSNVNDFVIVNGVLKEYKGNERFVEVPERVTTIGGEAFKGNSSIQSIKLPITVTVIKPGAFKYCIRLNSINIPVGVEKIGSETFFGCTNLTSIKLPYSVLTIDSHAFEECRRLETITIPDSVNFIGLAAFGECSDLKEFILPDGINKYEGSVIEKMMESYYLKESSVPRIALLFTILKYASKTVLKEKTVVEILSCNKWNLIKHAIKNDEAEVLIKILEYYKVSNSGELNDYIEFARNTVMSKTCLLDYKNKLSEKSKNTINEEIDKEYAL